MLALNASPRWPGSAGRGCSAGSSTRSPAAAAAARSTGSPWPCWCCAVAQTVLSRYALAIAYRFGERTAARIREGFLRPGARPCPPPWWSGCRPATWPPAAPPTSTRSPPPCATSCPAVFIGVVQIVFIVAAVRAAQPAARRRSACSGSSGIWFVTRWYLRRARDAYLRGGRGRTRCWPTNWPRPPRAPARSRRSACASAASRPGTRRSPRPAAPGWRTLALRSVLLPVGGDVVRGAGRAGAAARRRCSTSTAGVSLGTVGAAVLYLRQLVGPLDTHPDLDRAAAEQQRVVRPGRGPGRDARAAAGRRRRPAGRRPDRGHAACGTRTTPAATCCTTST